MRVVLKVVSTPRQPFHSGLRYFLLMCVTVDLSPCLQQCPIPVQGPLDMPGWSRNGQPIRLFSIHVSNIALVHLACPEGLPLHAPNP